MYLPSHFAWTDPASIEAFCRVHAFATLYAGGEAQHIPLLVERRDGALILRGHVAIGNPLWRSSEALAVFSGPHAYVSANWYGIDDMVPTWNYLAVHAGGPLAVIDDAAEIRACFAELARIDPEHEQWQERLSPAMEARLTAGIRWFRITATRTAGKAKLSQNRTLEVRHRVIAALLAQGDASSRHVAEAMQRCLDGLTPWPA